MSLADDSLNEIYRVPENISFPDEELKTLRYWKENRVFETCLDQSKDKPRCVRDATLIAHFSSCVECCIMQCIKPKTSTTCQFGFAIL